MKPEQMDSGIMRTGSGAMRITNKARWAKQEVLWMMPVYLTHTCGKSESCTREDTGPCDLEDIGSCACDDGEESSEDNAGVPEDSADDPDAFETSDEPRSCIRGGSGS